MTRAAGAGRRVVAGLAILAAGTSVVYVSKIARSRASPPLRCAAGMQAIGARCCGGGQALDAEGRCTGAASTCAEGLAPGAEGCVAADRRVAIPGGELHLGPGDWEAQGVVTPRTVRVAPFSIDAHETTEAAWRACVAAAACPAVSLRGEPSLPVIAVTLVEARAFCAAHGGALPSADQLVLAAAGPGARRYPWGETGAVCRRVAWGLAHGPCGDGARGPELVGSHPDGATPEGVHDLAGNVAEWAEPATPDAPIAQVFGGSWADAEAAALRTWSVRSVPATSRSPEIGFRCVYPVQVDAGPTPG